MNEKDIFYFDFELINSSGLIKSYTAFVDFCKNKQTVIIENKYEQAIALDSTVLILLKRMIAYCKNNNLDYQMVGFSEKIVSLANEDNKNKIVIKDIIDRFSEKIIETSLSFYEYVELNYNVLKASFTVLFRKKRFKKGEFIRNLTLIGLNAFPIIALVALLFGVVLTLQASLQLRQFGANIFVADLLGIGLTREMGPLITAIIVAGRSGSSIAAEIGTMKIMEEVDALKVMGLEPVEFVIIPKFYAILIALPLLTIMTNTIGILGGMFTSIFSLDLTASIFIYELFNALTVKDIFTGMIKSVAFAYLILTISSFYGFRVKSGAEDVGIFTTASVVAATFWVIVADAFFSIFFYYG